MRISFEGPLGQVIVEMQNFLVAQGRGETQNGGRVTSDLPKLPPKAEPENKPTETKTEAPAEDLSVKVKALGPKVAKAKGRQVVVDLLAKFGAKTGADVKPEQYEAFIAEAEALLK